MANKPEPKDLLLYNKVKKEISENINIQHIEVV